MKSAANTGGNDGSFQVRQSASAASSGTMGGPGGRRGVPLSVPLPFLLTGACAAALFGVLAPGILPLALVAPTFPQVLALVHTVTLGWLTMTIMGASLQLTPVIVVSPLRATRFLRWQYPLFLCGVVCLVNGFWWWQTWLLISGGTLVVLAVVQYVVVMATTFVHASTRPLTVRFLVASLIYLCIVVSLGLTAAWNFVFDFLGPGFEHILLAHITLGVVGWLSCTLIGVSYTLGRLFTLAHAHGDHWGKRIFLLLNGGIILLALGLVTGVDPLVWSGGALLICAAGLFVGDYWRLLRVRQRKSLEVTQYHSIAALFYFFAVITGGVLVVIGGWGTPAIETALGLAALIGWLGQSTVGYLYKIVPFLVWSERYGPHVGRQKVPLMRDLVHERWSWISWWLINLGLPGTIGAALLQQTLLLTIASSLFAPGLLIVLVNLAGCAWHLHIPR
jgi:hypothetical protein